MVVLVAGGGSVRVAHALHQPQGVGSVGRLPAVAVAGGGEVARSVVGAGYLGIRRIQKTELAGLKKSSSSRFMPILLQNNSIFSLLNLSGIRFSS